MPGAGGLPPTGPGLTTEAAVVARRGGSSAAHYDERERVFELFPRALGQLAAKRLVREGGLGYSLSFHFEMHRGLSVSSTPIDDELFTSFLAKLRRFISSDDPVSCVGFTTLFGGDSGATS